METSDNEDEYVAETSTNDQTAASSADAHPAADAETPQPESDTHFWQHNAEESFTQPFGRGNRAGMPGTIVMTPTDFTQVIEKESNTRRLSRQETSMGAFRSSQERIQLASGIDSATVHNKDEPASSNEKGTETAAAEKPADEAEEEIDHKSVADGSASPAANGQDAETAPKIARRKSMYLTDDMLKKESLEPYKIDIPLRKKVNKSTKKKLWREIERRKPFITESVREHIHNYAKPPFITWGCRNCVFPYESEA
ncbi:hypothetical protein V9T40_003861 [Parthenolecanium corni]|uniref:Uncharacterized protein n=1 Tax=Parthenolecanium corni TaxID=536013 RepID=A0AAN9TS30_9HEMI